MVWSKIYSETDPSKGSKEGVAVGEEVGPEDGETTGRYDGAFKGLDDGTFEERNDGTVVGLEDGVFVTAGLYSQPHWSCVGLKSSHKPLLYHAAA
jgi:hypothetical protein